MAQLNELELPELDVFSSEFLRDPHSYYAQSDGGTGGLRFACY